MILKLNSMQHRNGLLIDDLNLQLKDNRDKMIFVPHFDLICDV